MELNITTTFKDMILPNDFKNKIIMFNMNIYLYNSNKLTKE